MIVYRFHVHLAPGGKLDVWTTADELLDLIPVGTHEKRFATRSEAEAAARARVRELVEPLIAKMNAPTIEHHDYT